MKRAIFAAFMLVLVGMMNIAHAGLPPRVQAAYDRLAGVGGADDYPMIASSGCSIVVESRTVAPGDTFSVGIYVANDEPLMNLILPLAIRKLDGGASFRDIAGRFNFSSRLNGYLDGEYDGVNFLHPMMQFRGNLSHNYWLPCFDYHSPEPLIFESPDMVLIVLFSFMSGSELPPGDDGSPGNGSPLISLAFDAGLTPGQFEIGVGVGCPHVKMAATMGHWEDHDIPMVVPQFQRGIITIAGKPVNGVELNDPTFSPLPIGGPDGVWEGDANSGAAEIATDDSEASVASTTPRWSKSGATERPRQEIKPINDAGGADANGTDVAGTSAQTRSDVSTLKLYPNPFNAATTFEYDLAVAGRVQLDVYDVLGRRVSTLVDRYQDAGRYFATWTGYSSTGDPLPTGVYLYRYRTDNEPIVSGKMVYLK